MNLRILTTAAALAVPISGVLLSGCTPAVETEVIAAVLTGTESYQLRLASGDEEGARVVQQAQHFTVSEIRRDSSTQWAARYVYEPAAGFAGDDHVELEVLSGSDGASSPTRRRRLFIRFTVREQHPDVRGAEPASTDGDILARQMSAVPLGAICQITGTRHSQSDNVRLGAGLSFVAGATNAGAFLAEFSVIAALDDLRQAMR